MIIVLSKQRLLWITSKLTFMSDYMKQRNNDLLKGLSILFAYDNSYFAVGHDQVWAGPEAYKISSEDVKILEELNWFIDEDSYSRYV